MRRRGWITVALALAIALAVSAAASLWIWYRWMRTEPEPEQSAAMRQRIAEAAENRRRSAAQASEEPSGEPSAEPDGDVMPRSTPVVSLYSVETINSRPRALTAVTSRVIAASRIMQFTMDRHRDLTYRNARLGDLPMLEVYKDDGEEEKPLLLFLHGLGNDKESLISVLSVYAEAGYYAVGVDAFNQGDRYLKDSSVDTWAAVLITVGDIDPIIEYYRTVENVDAENFVLGGFSIGAVEAMAYVEIGSYTPSAVIALCGMCEYAAWQLWQQDDLTYGWLGDFWGTVWTFPTRQAFGYTGDKYANILSMDVTRNLDSFADIPILCCIGTADLFFNARNVQYAMQQLIDSGNARAECIVYPFGMHIITNRMLSDSLRFLAGEASAEP